MVQGKRPPPLRQHTSAGLATDSTLQTAALDTVMPGSGLDRILSAVRHISITVTYHLIDSCISLQSAQAVHDRPASLEATSLHVAL